MLSGRLVAEGLLDTNVFIHAHARDQWGDECRRFLFALERGDVHARLEALILHELSYALPHYIKQMTRDRMAEYLLMVLSWKGVRGEKGLMAEAVQRWQDHPGLAFVDAYLAALARTLDCPVYTKNVRELEAQGALVPQPLPWEAV